MHAQTCIECRYYALGEGYSPGPALLPLTLAVLCFSSHSPWLVCGYYAIGACSGKKERKSGRRERGNAGKRESDVVIDVRSAALLEPWKFGNLEIWKFGNLEIWKFGRFGSFEV